MTKLMKFIIEEDYEITDDDMVFVVNRVDEQLAKKSINKHQKFMNQNNVEKFDIILKTWEDYESDDYHFHSPPDCMYHKNDNSFIDAHIIQTFGGKEFTAYKEKDSIIYKIFDLYSCDPDYVLELNEWMFKFKE